MRDFSLAGWVLAFILAAFLYSEKVADGFSFGSGKAKQETQPSQPQQSVAKSNRPPPSTFKRQPPPREYEPDCTKREDSDLCAQRRMAIAAEDQGRLNVLGLILLFATLGFTGWAAWSAKRAAVATRDAAIAAEGSAATAIKTLKTMEGTAERQLRAYVTTLSGDSDPSTNAGT